MFSVRRIAQMAAFFAGKEGGAINVLKLTKLLYLSDRESMSQCGTPISYDRPVSMPEGPVLTNSLNLINGDFNRAGAQAWDEWMTGRSNYMVAAKRKFSTTDLDQLSNFDISVLEKVWDTFGPMDKYQLRDWTHDNCPEWTDPDGSSRPIDTLHWLRKLGKSEAEAMAFAKAIHDERSIDAIFGGL